jgi:hypothetical protein
MPLFSERRYREGDTMPHEMLNPSPKWGKAPLIDPTGLGYVYVGADIETPSRPGPVLRRSRDKKALVSRLKAAGGRLEQRDDVKEVRVFNATAFMPGGDYIKKHPEKAPPKFDVIVLVEARSEAALSDVVASDEYRALIAELETKARRMHVIQARNPKQIGDTERTRRGTFCFTHLVGDDPELLLENWERRGDWYLVETGLANSTLLVPLSGEQSDYVAIEYARWNVGLPRLFLRQLPKRSFWNYALKNLDAHNIGAWAVFYRLA